IRDLIVTGVQTCALPIFDGTGPGWRSLGEDDFLNVNCDADTWSFHNGQIQCKGTPTGVMRMKEPITNFELVVQWKHLKPGGNSRSEERRVGKEWRDRWTT